MGEEELDREAHEYNEREETENKHRPDLENLKSDIPRRIREETETELSEARRELDELKASQAEMSKYLTLGDAQDLALIKIRHLLNVVQGQLAYLWSISLLGVLKISLIKIRHLLNHVQGRLAYVAKPRREEDGQGEDGDRTRQSAARDQSIEGGPN